MAKTRRVVHAQLAAEVRSLRRRHQAHMPVAGAIIIAVFAFVAGLLVRLPGWMR